ncbi:TPA: hypothetical protein KPD70_000086 [Clostridioides difficile]|nr:hypothetical protein [Clostridioides difficile]HBG0376305.1 hypothetical protein [Clostridioides difficile]
MYTNLILYRNELKNKTIPKYKMIGIVTELLYSKIIFKKNKDISSFIKDVFNVEFKDYVMKSRSMIVARIGKIIIDSENDNEYKNKLVNFINLQIEVLKSNKDIKEKKNEFDGWIK